MQPWFLRGGTPVASKTGESLVMLPLGWDMSTWNGWGLKLVGRMIAAGAALIWFAFFVEHVADWFAGPPMPPPIVWAAQLAHLAILLGLLASLLLFVVQTR